MILSGKPGNPDRRVFSRSYQENLGGMPLMFLFQKLTGRQFEALLAIWNVLQVLAMTKRSILAPNQGVPNRQIDQLSS